MRCPTVGGRAHLTSLRARRRSPEVVSNPQEAGAAESSLFPRSKSVWRCVMFLERQRDREEPLGSLRGCLVEGSPEQLKLERRIRWRALAISIALQSAALVALILVPLFGKTQRLVLDKDFVSIPPYHRNASSAHQNSSTPPHRPSNNFTLFLTCPIHNMPTQRPNLDEPPQDVDLPESSGSASFDGNCSGCINIPGPEGPRPPQIPDET